jgi:hypothetical protein
LPEVPWFRLGTIRISAKPADERRPTRRQPCGGFAFRSGIAIVVGHGGCNLNRCPEFDDLFLDWSWV